MSDQGLSDLLEQKDSCYCQSVDYNGYTNTKRCNKQAMCRGPDSERKKYGCPHGKWDVLLLNSPLSYGSGYYCVIQIHGRCLVRDEAEDRKKMQTSWEYKKAQRDLITVYCFRRDIEGFEE